jgi:hypothetical protein
MVLPTWWHVVTPHKDILKGKLTEAIFAADLGDVARGNAPQEYQDASIFFQKTYLTTGLTKLVDNVLSRLAKGEGDPVIQLQTPFGGGKTHALLVLYHIVKSGKSVTHLLPLSSLPKAKAKVAVFVGTHADPLTGKTPWGEIAHQLGQYTVVEEHDKKRVSPGKERLREILEKSGPTLILMDEVLEYIVKANRAEKVERITQGQTLAFLQELSEVVASTPNCCLVVTLPASVLERYDEEAEKSLQQLQKIIGRIEAIYTPVEGIELYEVVRKRLFEELGDDKVRRQVADWYFNLYQKLGIEVPSEARETMYRDKIIRAYPFHPELIDVLYERWGSYPTFQRTRGVLRLLAEVVADLYSRKVVSPLIQSSVVALENQAIRREFIKHIGNEFDSVVSADIAGMNAKAPKIDKEMGSEYRKYDICKGIGTSVFLYSFSGGESREASLPRIRVALLREGIPVTIVGDAISRLEQELWYMHSENKQYAFRNQPNLNRVIADREETITDDRIEEKLKELVTSKAGKAMEIYLWPERTSDIPDNKNLKLAILSSALSQDAGTKFAMELMTSSGAGHRVYKNTLFILTTDENGHVNIRNTIRRHLALIYVQKSSDLIGRLTKQSQDELKNKLKDSEKVLPYGVLNAYRQLGLMGKGGMEWKDLGLPTSDSQSISERVLQRLLEDEKILARVTAKYVLDKTFTASENEKPLAEMYEILLKTIGLSVPESGTCLLNSIAKCVGDGSLGLRKNEKIHYKTDVTVEIDDIVLRKEYAETLIAAGGVGIGEGVVTGGVGAGEGGTTGEGEVTTTGHKPKGEVKRLKIRVIVPWDKLSYVMTGVILPLKYQGNPPKIVIEIEASSDEGFDRTTLNTKVKETLNQIGGTIEEWEEETD